MISIIICSRTNTISPYLSENIQNTIGCKHELIVIDNSKNAYSIFEAYNLGIDKSNGDFLCFMHDDVLLHTQNWGLLVNNIFDQNEKFGLLGVAGAKSKTKMPSAWWDCPAEDKFLYLKQHLRNGKVEDWDQGFKNKNIEKVVAIDGVFMIARRDKQFRFQESTKGFHCYDLNISFEYIKMGYGIIVVSSIVVEHFSLGKLDKNWYLASIIMHKMYSNLLPLKVEEGIAFKDFEFKNGINFIKGLLYYRLKKQAFLLWIQLIILKPITGYHFKFLKQMLK